jgi:hypothetical protein
LVVLSACGHGAAGVLFVVPELNGVFDNPAGGSNTGVGTSMFSTGVPLPTDPTALSSSISFLSFGNLVFELDDPSGPSGSVPIGRFGFRNGRTILDTSASRVDLYITGFGETPDLVPPSTIEIVGFNRIGLVDTPNTTGDAFSDGDYWIFPKIGRVLIPERSEGTVIAWARLVPVVSGASLRIARDGPATAPLQRYELELTRLVAESGVVVIPVPEPRSVVLMLFGMTALTIQRRVARVWVPRVPKSEPVPIGWQDHAAPVTRRGDTGG